MNDDGELENWVRARMYDPHAETVGVERGVKNAVAAAGGSESSGSGVNGVNGMNGVDSAVGRKSEDKGGREKSHL